MLAFPADYEYAETFVYNRKKDAQATTGQWYNELLSTDPWFKDVVPNFRVLEKKDIPDGADSGTAFTSVCINST